MVDDLFLPKKSQLYEWIKKQGRVRTSEVIAWGLDNYHIRADRDCRDLAQEGKIWRANDTVKFVCIGKTKEDLWSTHPADR